MQFVGWRVIIKRIKAIRFMMADKTVAKWKKLLVVLGIVYLFLPLDLIPPILFPFGILDDLVLWIFILYTLRGTLDKYWMGEKPKDYSKKYKDAIETTDFEVVDEEGAEDEETAEEATDAARAEESAEEAPQQDETK